MSELNLKISNDLKHFSHTPEIAQKYSDAQKAKIAKTSKDFESLLTAMMLKSMNKTKENETSGEDSYGGDYFESLFENEMAKHISNGNGLGIASELYKKITGEDLDMSSFKNSLEPFRIKSKVELKNFDKDSSGITPSKQSLERLEQFDEHIEEASKLYGVDKGLIKSVIIAESAGNVKAVSSAKAKGLMQLIDSTATSMGVHNVWDPRENIMGGTKYLSEMLRQYNGDVKLALAGYNAGPANVEKYKGVPPFEETKTYISRVLGYLNHLKEI
ncbi:MAG: transglycosylase SLT domain-containing protein [Ignavibacteriaceae bacterium]|nr:transglycosylase SLT domain-containing protein [Ignavibacteriaceae bacterium]